MSGVVSIFKPAFIYICICFHYLKNGSSVANNSDFCTTHDFCCHFCLLSPIGHSCDRLHERVCLWIAGLQYLFLSFSVLQVLFSEIFWEIFWEVKVQSLCTNDSIIRCLSVISSIDSFGKYFGKSLSFFPSFLPPSSSSLPIETR